ncbi:MAG: ABC transporter permease, partial [Candidatus Nanopelagicales bacterium]
MILIAARLALARILATKTRSGLTMLGIIIGVMSLIALVSVAQGATSGIQDQFKGLGARNLTITGTTNQSITIDDAKAIASQPGIEVVTETVSGRA